VITGNVVAACACATRVGPIMTVLCVIVNMGIGVGIQKPAFALTV